jgi:hypothetical protein
VRPPGAICRTALPTASALFGGEFAADILQRPRAGAVSVEGRIYGSVDHIKIPLVRLVTWFLARRTRSALLEAKRLDSLVGAKTMTIKKDGNDRG